MDNSVFRTSYDILIKVYRDNTYLNLLMKEISNKRVAKIVYGVLEKHYELNYIIDELAAKGVKPNVRPVLLIGAYSLLYLSTPENLVRTEIRELLDSLGKSGIRDFADAVMNKIIKKEYELPSKSHKSYLEVKYNLPNWLIGMYKKDYPDTYETLMGETHHNKVHIILNKNTSEKEIIEADKDCQKTDTGYFVKNTKEIAMLNLLGKISYMSYGSTLIAKSIEAKNKKILDLCAAPGGKSVYLALNGGEVTSCDVHEHRIELIKAYAKRMNVKLNIILRDATVFFPEWEQKFDVVLVDAPCSGFGVTGKKKDIVFNRSYEDIISLVKLQREILQNASRYVKKGGLLVYSTCTIFKKENGENVGFFLENNSDFTKEKINLPQGSDGEIQFLPDSNGMEGFYLCHLRRS